MITEVPEMFGAEQMLLHRCVSQEVSTRPRPCSTSTGTILCATASRCTATRHRAATRGISSLEDKSCGCVQKGGRAPIEDVIPYAGQIRKKGLRCLPDRAAIWSQPPI